MYPKSPRPVQEPFGNEVQIKQYESDLLPCYTSLYLIEPIGQVHESNVYHLDAP
jgi:hypothetical protein